MFTIELLSPTPGGDDPDPERVKALLLKALASALWMVADAGPPEASDWTDEDYALMRQILYVNEKG